ncbi:hypothetical protein [Streptomyces sp. NPDC050704]|uniref:hypothetical protein n=1 Tax=Streptomyces sp. NPDC050704 TaxID=3157219 RepID=UPI0034252163
MPDNTAGLPPERRAREREREAATGMTTGAEGGTARGGAGLQEGTRSREGGGPTTGGPTTGGPATGGPATGGAAGREGMAGMAGDTGPAGREGTQAPEGVAARAGTGGRDAADRAGGAGSGGRLLSHNDGDKWTLQLQHAVAGFVDAPRDSVEEADKVLQEVTSRFTDAVTERRRTLRTSWQTAGEDKNDTEQLRLVLRDYRELAERLLRL